MPNNRQTKVLILSCNTGEGHNSAAKAIQANLTEKRVPCELKDVLTFKSEKASERISRLYNTAIKKVPTLFGIAFTLGKVYDDLRLPSPIYKANAGYADKLYRYIIENGFNRIVCTHLFAMMAVTAVRRKYRLSAACYGVMTDYVIHPFMRDSDLDGYFVPNKTVKKQFIKKGFSEDKLFVTGIPVHRKFNQAISKREAREYLGLPQDEKVVLIMTGGAGCGKIIRLCKKLDKAFGEVRFIVLTGRNDKLKENIDGLFENNEKIQTAAFTPNVHLYLRAADCVLSKSGGLSSTEIAVANVPLIHLKAIPGLETANLKYFYKRGLSLRANTVMQAVKCVKAIFAEEFYGKAMLLLQRAYIKQNATEYITEKITEGINNERTYLAAAYSRRIHFGESDVLQDDPEAIPA